MRLYHLKSGGRGDGYYAHDPNSGFGPFHWRMVVRITFPQRVTSRLLNGSGVPSLALALLAFPAEGLSGVAFSRRQDSLSGEIGCVPCHRNEAFYVHV